MCVECAHIVQVSALSAAGVLAYLHRFLKGRVTPRHLMAECDITSKSQSQESQMRDLSFPARRSESENDEKESFVQAPSGAPDKRLLERRAETSEDAQLSMEVA